MPSPLQKKTMPFWSVVLATCVLVGGITYLVFFAGGLRTGGYASSGASLGLFGERSRETGRLEGTMTIKLCREERGGTCTPTAETFALHKVYLLSDFDELYTLTPDAEGIFAASLPTGTYTADIETHAGLRSVSGVPAALTIEAGHISLLLIAIDTEIR